MKIKAKIKAGAWPKQWKVNGFDGKSNDIVTEEITFVVEEMEIA